MQSPLKGAFAKFCNVTIPRPAMSHLDLALLVNSLNLWDPVYMTPLNVRALFSLAKAGLVDDPSYLDWPQFQLVLALLATVKSASETGVRVPTGLDHHPLEEVAVIFRESKAKDVGRQMSRLCRQVIATEPKKYVGPTAKILASRAEPRLWMKRSELAGPWGSARGAEGAEGGGGARATLPPPIAGDAEDAAGSPGASP